MTDQEVVDVFLEHQPKEGVERLESFRRNAILREEGVLLNLIDELKVGQSIEDFGFRVNPVKLKGMVLKVRKSTEFGRRDEGMHREGLEGPCRRYSRKEKGRTGRSKQIPRSIGPPKLPDMRRGTPFPASVASLKVRPAAV